MGPTIRGIEDPYLALGIASHFLARRAPFSGFRFADLVQTLDQQVRRRHALFGFEGGRMVGYVGWSLFTREDALLFAETGRPPPVEKPDGGEVMWVMTVAAVAPGTTRAMIDEALSRHVGLRAMGVRHKPNGKRVVFDQAIRARRPGAAPAG